LPRIVLEATGGYEVLVVAALAAAAYPVDGLRPALRPLADADAQELEALLTRRRRLLGMLQAERILVGHVFGGGERGVRKSLTAHIA